MKLNLCFLSAAALVSAATAAGPARVNLGTAGDFVILAKSGISNVPKSAITGDIGVSPIAATAITGFSLTMDSTTTFSTSDQITGSAYAASYTSPTPTKMTAAIGDMEAAYTDAAGRTNPDFNEFGAGAIGGQTLAPGLYKWTTSVNIPSNGVTFSGTEDDIFILQISGDLIVAAGNEVTLTGGVKPENIFWQVAGTVEVGAGSHMEGIIMGRMGANFLSGSSLNGRVLAQTACTLVGNTITQPAVTRRSLRGNTLSY
jgi:hypothetical protein